MTGFIKGLFSKKKDDDASADKAKPKNTGAYFLEPDDAKTFGDIDYMRTSKTVKRTFAKGEARVREVSAMKDAELKNGVAPSTSASQQPTFQPQPQAQPETKSFQSASEAAKRRAPDSSMDMFRNMAKDIRKG